MLIGKNSWKGLLLLIYVALTICAANGVALRLPLSLSLPEDDHEIALPFISVMVTMVLLKDAWMCACPFSTRFMSFLFLIFFLAIPAITRLPYFFLRLTVRLGPLRVLAFCLVL